MTSPFATYLAGIAEPNRTALRALHETVAAAVPGCEQVIRVGVPAYRHRGKPLVSIGSARRHVALYVMYGNVLKTHAVHLQGYDTSNPVVRFDPRRPIPVDLVRQLVAARAAEIDSRLS